MFIVRLSLLPETSEIRTLSILSKTTKVTPVDCCLNWSISPLVRNIFVASYVFVLLMGELPSAKSNIDHEPPPLNNSQPATKTVKGNETLDEAKRLVMTLLFDNVSE